MSNQGTNISNANQPDGFICPYLGECPYRQVQEQDFDQVDARQRPRPYYYHRPQYYHRPHYYHRPYNYPLPFLYPFFQSYYPTDFYDDYY